jgi:1,4-dihydroxy-2-naphthoyl-CoA hydrolase
VQHVSLANPRTLASHGQQSLKAALSRNRTGTAYAANQRAGNIPWGGCPVPDLKEAAMLHLRTVDLTGTPANDAEPLVLPYMKPAEQPFPRLIGLEFTEATPTRLRATLAPRNELCRSGNALHGGVIMSLADIVASCGAWLNLPEGANTTTIESKTNFIGAAKEGEPLFAESVPLHVGKRSSVWQTTITRADGKLVAMVIQTQMVI